VPSCPANHYHRTRLVFRDCTCGAKMDRVCVWPDGTWYYFEELEEVPWKSDDFAVIEVPNDVEDIDEWLIQEEFC